MKTHPIVGVWTLVSCEHRLENGERFFPMGETPNGRVIFTADGFMTVILSGTSRSLSEQSYLFGSSEKERAAAAQSYVSYSGRYEIQNDLLVTHVDLSLFPNWVGSDQKRNFNIEGNTITFSTKPFVAKEGKQTAHLVWQRETCVP